MVLMAEIGHSRQFFIVMMCTAVLHVVISTTEFIKGSKDEVSVVNKSEGSDD